MMNLSDIRQEVERRANIENSQTAMDTPVERIINTSILRISKEVTFRTQKRSADIQLKTTYSTGSGACEATNGSTAVTITGATLLSDGVEVGRRIKIEGSGRYYKIAQITGETTLVLDQEFNGTTSSTLTYAILPQSVYRLPYGCDGRFFLFHTIDGWKQPLRYLSSEEFEMSKTIDNSTGTPDRYTLVSKDMSMSKLKSPSVVTVASSSASDTGRIITVRGIVAGYPDYEEITLNGSDATVSVSGSKSFSEIFSIAKNTSSSGRITLTANSGNTTVAVIPVGSNGVSLSYQTIELFPLPSQSGTLSITYWKKPEYIFSDYDYHELGEEADEAIINLSVARIRQERNESSSAAAYWQLYRNELLLLRKTNLEKSDRHAKRENNLKTMRSYSVFYPEMAGNIGIRV
jgi:hypothetical protein